MINSNVSIIKGNLQQPSNHQIPPPTEEITTKQNYSKALYKNLINYDMQEQIRTTN